MESNWAVFWVLFGWWFSGFISICFLLGFYSFTGDEFKWKDIAKAFFVGWIGPILPIVVIFAITMDWIIHFKFWDQPVFPKKRGKNESLTDYLDRG